ncbi:MAG: deoxynucleoside kinase [Pseudomonadota bacterium]
MNELNYIAVDGPIGAGKTTLVNMLSKTLAAKAFYEPASKNPFLPDFYSNPDDNAFKTQLFFLLSRYQQQAEITRRCIDNKRVICDYTFAKDSIFAGVNLKTDELELYNSIFELLSTKLVKPNLAIYLRAEGKVLLQRIKKRNIDYEKKINISYLDRLTNAFDDYFLKYTKTPLLVVETTNADYLSSPEDFENLKKEIKNHRGGTVHFISR